MRSSGAVGEGGAVTSYGTPHFNGSDLFCPHIRVDTGVRSLLRDQKLNVARP